MMPREPASYRGDDKLVGVVTFMVSMGFRGFR